VVIGPDRTQEVRASHHPQPATGVDLDPRRLAAPVRCDDGHDDRRDGKQTTWIKRVLRRAYLAIRI
jgi:hypothetical protein